MKKTKVLFFSILVLITMILTGYFLFNMYTKQFFSYIYLDKALYPQSIKIKCDMVSYYKEYRKKLNLEGQVSVRPAIFIFSDGYQNDLNKNFKKIQKIVEKYRIDHKDKEFYSGLIGDSFAKNVYAFTLTDGPIIFIKKTENFKGSVFTEIGHLYLRKNVKSNIYNLHFFSELFNNFLSDYLTDSSVAKIIEKNLKLKYKSTSEEKKEYFLLVFLKTLYPNLTDKNNDLFDNFDEFLKSVKSENKEVWYYTKIETRYINRIVLISPFMYYLIIKYGNDAFMNFFHQLYSKENYLETTYQSVFNESMEEDLKYFYNILKQYFKEK